MSVLSYSVNEKGICSILSQGSNIQDILVRDTNPHMSKQMSFQAATFSSFNLARRCGFNDIDLVRIPPILKNDKQKMIIKSASETTGVNYTETSERPLYSCAAYMNMYQSKKVRFSSIEGVGNNLIIYTDASVKDGLETTVSFTLLDENRDLIMLFALEVGEPRKPDIAELEAGLIALKTVKHLTNKPTKKRWYCDNETAVLAFKQNKFPDSVTKYKSRVNNMTIPNIQYESLNGRDNKLADALCDDVRFNEFEGSLIYTSECMNTNNTLREITEIASEFV